MESLTAHDAGRQVRQMAARIVRALDDAEDSLLDSDMAKAELIIATQSSELRDQWRESGSPADTGKLIDRFQLLLLVSKSNLLEAIRTLRNVIQLASANTWPNCPRSYARQYARLAK